jgi:hypothetical protein
MRVQLRLPAPRLLTGLAGRRRLLLFRSNLDRVLQHRILEQLLANHVDQLDPGKLQQLDGLL